ncbi:conserved hypothetical protein [Vibrio crassostreae]|uniref:hypothetical protein n=1 Tax=Vibrio crassostreae TaxID=246167 RepID=UPI001B304EDC|nr:hypothetical protein [Vibrio crassostreae]CAK1725612.1 conserved hypothetical protein [Vibrio crassostreae]CAK1964547.1 conserved hypothetical protein [Vibrio crassostreae]CAK2251373.1 conserved hypothetical protein [Vibrio crassostreae]CAK2376395.1 conserved hypothetical protein [Vibrio crassostreae]CAK2837991.1 conserved hypothetical protein [Vibrio crassostreae]
MTINTNILPFESEPVKGLYSKPEDKEFKKLNPKTLSAIINAWNKVAILSEQGQVWLESSKIHTIIRTTPANGKYWVGQLPNSMKLKAYGHTYIHSSEVISKLDHSIQSARSMSREKYLEYSFSIASAIRKCSRARELRGQHYENFKRDLKSLKNNRIKSFKIKEDELTGNELLVRTAEFSHIRSVSIYPQFAHYLGNGLIVNHETHEIITAHNINDEIQLLDLCKKMKWETKWYKKFKYEFLE